MTMAKEKATDQLLLKRSGHPLAVRRTRACAPRMGGEVAERERGREGERERGREGEKVCVCVRAHVRVCVQTSVVRRMVLCLAVPVGTVCHRQLNLALALCPCPCPYPLPFALALARAVPAGTRWRTLLSVDDIVEQPVKRVVEQKRKCWGILLISF